MNPKLIIALGFVSIFISIFIIGLNISTYLTTGFPVSLFPIPLCIYGIVFACKGIANTKF